jgi:hypothetical protein
MLSLSAGQADLANRANMVAVHQYFRGLLQHISDLDESMPHLTLGLGNRIGTPRLMIRVANEEIEGERLWKTLKALNLSFAEIEYAEILVNPDRFMVAGATGWWDLRDLAGTEHTHRFRGELIGGNMVEDDNAFELEFKKTTPEVPVIELLDQANNDPKDFGSVLPIVYGSAKRVRCRNIQVGRATALSQALTDVTTGVIEVTNAEGFPTSATFYGLAGREIIQFSDSSETDGTLTIAARAQNGTFATDHLAGEIIIELIDEVIVGLAGHQCPDWTDAQALYCRSPYTGELVRFTNIAVFNMRDQNVPGMDGETVATVRIAQEQVEDFLLSTNVSPRVTVQAEIAGSGGNPGPHNWTPDDQTVFGHIGASRGYWTDVGTDTPQWNPRVWSPRSGLSCEWDAPAPSTNPVLRWRIKLAVAFTGVSDWSRVRCYPKDISGFEDGYSIGVATKDFDTTKTAYSPWRQPVGTVIPGDLITDNSQFRLFAAGVGTCHVTTLEIEIEVEDNTPPTVARETDVQIEAGSVGFGLEFFADFIGNLVPYQYTQDYDFTEGTGWDDDNGTQSDRSPNGQRLTASSGPVTATMQRLASSNPDLTATDDRYRLRVFCDNPSLLDPTEDILVWFNNSGGASGPPIVKPTNRVELKIPPNQLKTASWVTLEVDGVDIGSPTVTSIETIGLEFVTLSGTPYVQIDDLETANATNTDYDPLAPGSVITDIADIATHFLVTVCGLGSSVIGTFDGPFGNWAGDITTYGTGFESILAGLAFEGGANIVREEGASGSIYNFLFADEASGIWKYPATVRTIDTWNRLTERLRPIDETATRFRAFWAWDASLGTDSRAFRQLSRADTTVNDTKVPNADFDSAELRIGQRDAVPLPFYLIQDEVTAEDILGFYTQEALANTRVGWDMVVPHWLSYDLQRGDTVEFTPPWEASARKARVLGIMRGYQSPIASLVLVEVLVET